MFSSVSRARAEITTCTVELFERIERGTYLIISRPLSII